VPYWYHTHFSQSFGSLCCCGDRVLISMSMLDAISYVNIIIICFEKVTTERLFFFKEEIVFINKHLVVRGVVG
jgi:hypothetical protein